MVAPENNILPLPFETPEVPPSVALKPVLNRLRFLAKGCRASARLDLFRACDFLDPDESVVARASATAVVRTLDQATGRVMVLFGPGTPDISHDEAWLLRLIERSKVGDHDSVKFLLNRQVKPERRQVFLHLIQTLANNLEAFQRS